jgi:hypothetical protein
MGMSTIVLLLLLAIAVYYAIVIAVLEWYYWPTRRYETELAEAVETFKADGDWERLIAVLSRDPRARRRGRRSNRRWRVWLRFAIVLDLAAGLVIAVGRREDWW